jgi:hypothetical protein
MLKVKFTNNKHRVFDNLVKLFVLASASISIESTSSALTAFVACNNLVIESTMNLPTTSLFDIEAISRIAGWFDQENIISYLLSRNIMDIQSADKTI